MEGGPAAGAGGLTLLLTTHYLEEADQLAQRIAIVDGGRVVAAGTPEELKREIPGDAVTLDDVYLKATGHPYRGERSDGLPLDTWYLFVRLLRATARMPVFVLISIVQPILWVLLFGQLFAKVTTIQGFGASSYVQFLAPGISIMTALFGAAYSGMGMLGDIDRGVLDRLLATPVSRGALIASRILHSAVQVVIQAAIILAVACLLGARPQGGLPGILTVFLAAALLGAAFAAFSNALALPPASRSW